MCDGASWIAAAKWATAAMTAYAGYNEYQTGKERARYEVEQAEQNSALSQQQARDANLRGVVEADEQRMRTRQAIGQQRAALAGQGVEVGSGTSLEVLGDTEMFGKIDEDRIRLMASREAWGYQVQGLQYQDQARMTRWNSKREGQATILGTAAKVAGSFVTAGA